MGLPSDVVARIPNEGGMVALRMRMGSQERDFYFLIRAKEGPNNLREFSLGSASALNSAGTDWSEIQDSNNRYHLEPEFDSYLYLAFYGISPAIARVYRRYPSNVDLGSLLGTRALGGTTGFIDGEISPPLSPSPETEFWTLKGQHPAFWGYHPYARPSSITVRVDFYISKFKVDHIVTPTQEQKAKAVIHTMGGVTLLEAPEWVR